MADDLGTRPLSAGTLTALRERLHHDGSRAHEMRNPAAVYFERGGYWLIFCLFALAPLALLALLRLWSRRRAAAALLALTALGLVAGQLLFSHIVSFRYLHPFPPLLLICAAAALVPQVRRRNTLDALA